MHKDEIKGKMKDIKGRLERQAGEWTGDQHAQLKGMADQAEGKLQQGAGKLEDAGHKIVREVRKRSGHDADPEKKPGADRDRDITERNRNVA
jgi:uncharacterized protein YjbJ (UPF0337 family)